MNGQTFPGDTDKDTQQQFQQPPPISGAPEPDNKKKIIIEIAVGVFAVLVLSGVFYYVSNLREEARLADYKRGAVFQLVADKISQSAPIKINLPQGVNLADARAAITFTPAIEGEWLPTDEENTLLYKPRQKLALGQYYSVYLSANGAEMIKEFKIDEDPEVVAVFPTGGETNEFSEITAVFNRPMVPLTTLDSPLTEEIPIEIVPRTEGRFKWITTRSVQFIPASRLQRSTTYTVSIKDGFVSLDGLAAPRFSHTFTTRPLRLEHIAGGKAGFSRPVSVKFNQPVDIERTRQEIEVFRSSGQREQIPFVLSYGTRNVYDPDKRKTVEFLDKSFIEIYNAEDRHGRERLWDFGESYQITLKRAYPAEGDLTFDQQQSVFISVPDIIVSLEAESDRSKYAAPDIFDPQGLLWVTFAEEVNKDWSRFEAKGLVEVGYGEKCKLDEGGRIIRFGGKDCEKEDDYTKLSFRFDGTRLGLGETIPINFKRVFNREGLQINKDELTRKLTVYGKLNISKTIPANGDTGADLTEMTICTNTPLEPATEENFKERVRFNTPIGLWNWRSPYRVTPQHRNPPCAAGEFVNTIQYGLPPERDIEINLNVVDDFGQSIQRTVRFATGELDIDARKFIHMQKAYNVTSPARTTLTYAVENFSYINMDICEITPQAMLEFLVKRGPAQNQSPKSFSCASRLTDKIQLPDRFWTRNFFQVNFKDYVKNPFGHYIVTFSHPDYQFVRHTYDSAKQRYITTKTGELIYEHTLLSVTNLAVQEKQVEWEGSAGYSYDDSASTTEKALQEKGFNLYWVSRINDLTPVNGARVDVYRSDIRPSAKGGSASLARAGISFTDAGGIAKTPVIRNHIGAIVTYGNDSTVIEEQYDKLQWASLARSASRAYIYTDRPIYRPGQEVFVKGIHRIGYDADYEVAAGRKDTVKVFNSRRETVFEQEAVLSENGTFDFSFKIDPQASLGTYRVSAFNGNVYFDVEEYSAAAFKIDLKTDKEEYIAGDIMEMDVQADYYFGVPLDGGEVAYTITAQNFNFDRFDDASYRFGASRYYDYGYYGYGDAFLLRGKTELDSKGNADIAQEIDFQKLFKEDERDGSKIFIFDVTVKNNSGQSVSAQKSFIVHRGDRYLGIKLDKSFMRSGEQFSAFVKSVDVQGRPVRIKDGVLEINKVTWEYFKRREVDGGYYYSWDRKKERVLESPIFTDNNGDFSQFIILEQPGEYEIAVRVKDARGNEVSSVREIYVYGAGSVTVRPTNNETLELATDKQDLDVGEKANIVIKSPYQKAKALVTFERGTIFRYDVIDVNSNLVNYEFTAEEKHIPNVFVSVLLLSPDPEIKFGQINYRINTKRKAVTVDVRTDKTHYLPGEEVRLSLATKDWTGKPISVELSVAVADLSVLALKGNPKKNPIVFFYGGMPLTITTASNIKNVLPEVEVSIGTKGGSGGGPEDLAKKQRGVFKDTAFWSAIVRTDEEGKAAVSFTLPDNLTQWQAEAVGVTPDTKLGVGYSDFITRKEIMLVPLKPRFIIPSDKFMIGAKIFNETDRSQRLTVNLDAPTLQLLEGEMPLTTIEVPSKGSETVYFSVQAPSSIRDGSHELTLSARNKDYDDTVLQRIPVERNNTYESVATAHFTQDGQTKEFLFVPEGVEPDRGELRVNAGATLAVFLSDALNYLVTYPYGCSEQIASKLSSIAIVKKGLNIENIGDKFELPKATFEGREYTVDELVEVGLARIYENQTAGGGFTYYKNMRPNFYLTLHIVQTLKDLQEAGFAVNQNAIDRAAAYLFSEISRDYQLRQSKDTVILTAYALARVGANDSYQSQLRALVLPLTEDNLFMNERISYTTLAQLAMLTTYDGYSSVLKDKAYTVLENKITIDARGAHIGMNSGSWMYQYYETPVKNTALLVKALVKDRRESVMTDDLLRWIIRSKSKDGSWGSTNNTLAVVDAFADFLRWKKETESEYRLAVRLDDETIGEFEFNADTILDMMRAAVPMNRLKQNRFQEVAFEKEDINNAVNTLYYDMSLQYFLPIEQIPARDEGFGVERSFYALEDADFAEPLSEAKAGDVLKGRLVLTVSKQRNFVAVEDFIPAGLEIVNLRLATEDQSLKQEQYRGRGANYCTSCRDAAGRGEGGFSAALWAAVGSAGDAIGGAIDSVKGVLTGKTVNLRAKLPELPDEMYANRRARHMQLGVSQQELYDDRVFLFVEQLPPGVYDFEYFVRALIPGEYHHLPAVASEMYFPENFGRTDGNTFRVVK